MTVRINFASYAGLVVMHCHQFDHEDEGCMSVMEVLGPEGESYAGSTTSVAPWEEREEEPEEPETDCGDCVTQAQYDELYAMVESQQETIEALQTAVENYGALEVTVDTVETQLTNLASCLSYESTYEPEPTEEPMTEAPVTEEPATEEPTMTYRMAAVELQGVTCSSGNDRSFKTAFDSAEACAERCEADDSCMFFSFNPENLQCIGCDVEPSLINNFTGDYETYEMVIYGRRARRQLSELELLRAENEALKAALERARRN